MREGFDSFYADKNPFRVEKLFNAFCSGGVVNSGGARKTDNVE